MVLQNSFDIVQFFLNLGVQFTLFRTTTVLRGATLFFSLELFLLYLLYHLGISQCLV